MTVQRAWKTAAMAAALAVIGSGGLLLAQASGPGTGFQGSPHDFASRAAGTNQRYGGQVVTGACTFCHTPHKAQSTRLLWNHTNSNNNFSWSDASATVGGTPLPTISGTTYSGPTRFCLSCHDGSVAIGDISWFNRQAWIGGNALDSTKHTSGQYNIASTTGDLRGNHPVAVPYPFGQARNTYNGVTTGDATFMQDFNGDPTSLGIRLFNDTGSAVVGGALAGKSGIECTSCHGVHNERNVVVDEPLLRGSKGGTGSTYICMKCHTRN